MSSALFISHFDRLSEAPDAVLRLRRFIFDLAVRGMLVEQDPRDEPASELLKRIEDDVRERKAAGEYSDPRSFVEIQLESLPFAVPLSWRWARLIEIADVSYGFAFESSHFTLTKSGKPLIRIRDISSTDTEAYYDGNFDEAYLVHKGDYLVGMDGDFNLRKWKGPDALLNQRVIRLNNWRASLVPEFLAIPFQMILDHLHAEQHRIVAKVDELIGLCDRMEAQLTTTQTENRRLLEAVLHDGLKPAV